VASTRLDPDTPPAHACAVVVFLATCHARATSPIATFAAPPPPLPQAAAASLPPARYLSSLLSLLLAPTPTPTVGAHLLTWPRLALESRVTWALRSFGPLRALALTAPHLRSVLPFVIDDSCDSAGPADGPPADGASSPTIASPVPFGGDAPARLLCVLLTALPQTALAAVLLAPFAGVPEARTGGVTPEARGAEAALTRTLFPLVSDGSAAALGPLPAGVARTVGRWALALCGWAVAARCDPMLGPFACVHGLPTAPPLRRPSTTLTGVPASAGAPAPVLHPGDPPAVLDSTTNPTWLFRLPTASDDACSSGELPTPAAYAELATAAAGVPVSLVDPSLPATSAAVAPSGGGRKRMAAVSTRSMGMTPVPLAQWWAWWGVVWRCCASVAALTNGAPEASLDDVGIGPKAAVNTPRTAKLRGRWVAALLEAIGACWVDSATDERRGEVSAVPLGL